MFCEWFSQLNGSTFFGFFFHTSHKTAKRSTDQHTSNEFEPIKEMKHTDKAKNQREYDGPENS